MTENFSSDHSGCDEDGLLGQTGKQASRAYNWYSRITTWKARLKTLLAWLKTKAGLTVVGALAGGGAVGAVLTVDPGFLSSRHSVEAPAQRWGEAVVFPIDGVDLAGRKASFDLVLMPKDYTWALGSSTELALRGEPRARPTPSPGFSAGRCAKG